MYRDLLKLTAKSLPRKLERELLGQIHKLAPFWVATDYQPASLGGHES